MEDIRRVAVIGAGVMGASIAAHVANAGLPVVLLDIVAKDGDDRSAIARGAIDRMLKTEPAPFMSKAAAKLVTAGNIDDDLGLIADCDLIIEAVVERLDVKQALYERIDALRKPTSLVSSNTSTIPLARLVESQSAAFRRDFVITHFFNPPRYMRLLEVVGGADTRPDALDAVTAFADLVLGKSVVRCKDRPGFIANRLGIFWLAVGVAEAAERGLAVEDADALIGRPFGIPKTGIFALIDLVGLDLMPHVIGSMAGALAPDDLFHRVNRPVATVEAMIRAGYTGRKGKGGFYRLNRERGKVKEAVDLATGDYRPERPARVPAIEEAGRSMEALMRHPGQHGRYARAVMASTLAYAALLVGDASDEVDAIDEAMRLGYNWKEGPFELIDRIGVDRFAALIAEDGLPVAPILRIAAGRSFYRVEGGIRQVLGLDGQYRDLARPAGVIMLADVKRAGEPVLKNGSAALWDVGDGVACLEFTAKMNTLDPDVMDLIVQAVPVVAERFRALVIYNEGSNFSVGANLGLALFAANIAAWGEIEKLVAAGQEAFKALKYAPFPVVGAPSGMALGGGCEILLHCHAVQAHAETYMGLVEAGVGVVPGWGGCKEMLARWQATPKQPRGPMPGPMKVFEIVSTATVSKSAADAGDLLYLRPRDGITMNRYRLLADAKAMALRLAEDFATPVPPDYILPGPTGRTAMEMAVAQFARLGKATPHDIVVAGGLAEVLSGGETDLLQPLGEDDVLALERRVFMRLLRTPGTLARVEHMLETGKPLRN
ncbi:3-hydroxyacyl-CoA dehydrogenase [Hyphomicrobiaceae bacterium 22]|uniref:3-hydroxyacyl-CoA dehydrogenase n=1 Tax=Prosthecodimorpha staleyi TaxID=2840188 RepID=A0A947D5J3_9HYPH|nr:3-hydroxyacyl-CoA dehydrogenase [Prosthecodimorpha staleyi]